MEQNKQVQRPTSNQRSLSTLTIDTMAAQNTFAPQLRRNKSVAQPRPRSIYSAEPVMSSDELNAKIADSFQQFCSMLNQMQKTAPTPTTATVNKKETALKASHKVNNNNKSQQSQPSPIQSPISMITSSPSTIPSSNDTTPNIRRHSSILPMDGLSSSLSSIHSPSTSIKQQQQNKKAKKKKPIVEIQDKELVKTFLAAASNGKINVIKDMIQSCKDLIYAMDQDDGTTALIYASCFGHIDIVELLLQSGAPIDEQDNFGWTALMWATVNHHGSIVDLLLSHRAKPEIQTTTGNTVVDFILKDDNRMADLLKDAAKYSKKQIITMDRTALKRKMKLKNKLSQVANFKATRRQSTPIIPSSSSSATSSKKSTFQHSGMDAYTHFMTAESDRHRLLTQRHELFYDLLSNNNSSNNYDSRRGKSMDGDGGSIVNGTVLGDKTNQHGKWINGLNQGDHNIEGEGNDEEDNDDDEEEDEASQIAKFEASIRSTNIFIWDRCLVDQMFVFSLDNLQVILDTALDFKNLSKPILPNDEHMWVPANILFLCARFAHYYSCRGTLDQFFQLTFNKLTQLVKQSTKDGQQLCFWMTNIYQLLIYLRRDSGLNGATQEHQFKLSDIFIELYTLFIKDCEKRLDKVIEPGLLDFEPIQEMLPVDFVDSNEWSKFFQRRNSVRVSMDGNSASAADNNNYNNSNNETGPHYIISTFNQLKKTMSFTFDLPEFITKQILSQCFYYILSEAFNRILMNKRYLCRSKALHIKLNLSVLEEWGQDQHFDDLLYDAKTESKNLGIDRLTQLLQLLQCVSGLNNVDVFTSTCQSFHLLNALQIKKCVVQYRYEVQEAQLPKYLEEWVIQRATIDIPKTRQSSSSFDEKRKSYSSTTTTTSTNSLLLENTNLKQLSHLLNGNQKEIESKKKDNNREEDGQQVYYNNRTEYIDSKWVIPFYQQKPNQPLEYNIEGLWEKNKSSESMYQELKQKAEREKKGSTTRIPLLPYKLVDKLDKKLHK
ncbi:hypothetical protein BJ944DRAFT_178555 [Cunninghamella echinulata]|nr:hypothetical protein BJ944DRAFT_178555 [Cunninghamella echinulata]